MSKEELLRCIAEGLNHILGLNLDEKDKKTVNAAVDMFIIEDASRYDEDELVNNFDTMEKGLHRFMCYMEAQRLREGETIH